MRPGEDSYLNRLAIRSTPSSEKRRAARVISNIRRAEQALVAGSRDLITRSAKKIQTTLARIWGEEPAAKSIV